MSKYLWFQEYPSDSGKTVLVSVLSKSSGDKLAEIRWYGPWRQYCFYPWPGTIWNPGCLDDVKDYIYMLMAARVTKMPEIPDTVAP